ncbi:MAG: hypothetical protein ACK532_05060, partial [Acidobacteriota bacterium]
MRTIRRTTIYIAMGGRTQVFPSPDQIPTPLRKQLIQSTRGMNSATILIADRGGREEIRKILTGQPSALRSRLRADFLRRSVGEADTSAAAVPSRNRLTWRSWSYRQWAELILPGAVGLGLWLLFS